jgi:glycosyltransferase involved in cell wall biosynthesis
MKLLMISGDRSILQGKKGAFWYTLEEFCKSWDRIDIIVPRCETRDLRLETREKEDTHVSGLKSQVFPNVYFHPSPKALWYQPWWILRKGQELIAEHRHDVMTVHEYPPFYNGLGALWLWKKCKIPYALEIHHIVGYPTAASFQELIGRWMARLFLGWDAKRAAAVRTVSSSVAKVLPSFGIHSEKISIVPSFYLDHSLGSLKVPDAKKFDLVFAGRLVANKGLSNLLKALKGIPEATLLIIGDGPLRSFHEAEAEKLGIASRVTFVGWLPTQEEVMQQMLKAQVFVLPSLSEGGPRIALEAMAAGLPVLSTKVGVMPDVLEEGKNGLFTSGSVEDLRQKIIYLLSNEAVCERLGTEARKILDRFERRTLIGNYASFLQRLPTEQK